MSANIVSVDEESLRNAAAEALGKLYEMAPDVDIFNLTDLTSAYGGAGADVFNFAVNSNLTKVSKVYEVGAGDVFNLKDNGTVGAGAVVTKFYATGAQYNPDTTTDVAGKVNAADRYADDRMRFLR